jgi:DNA-binding PadR family transcriptional regulator
MSTRQVPRRAASLTTPDLVVLSLLAERPMHGYEANAELGRRQVHDWAGISRPQVYYSLEKLERQRLIREVAEGGASAGPDRRVFATTPAGQSALSDALEREDWATDADQPLFLTWMALSWKARPGVFDTQLVHREAFVESQIRRSETTLRGVLAEVGHPHHEAVWMLQLTIEKLKAERRWLKSVRRQARRRAAARFAPMPMPAKGQGTS